MIGSRPSWRFPRRPSASALCPRARILTMALASRGRPGRPESSALGIPSSSYCTYLRGFNPFILTVTTIEYTPEDATVPRGVSLSRKFLRQKPFSYVTSTLPDMAPSPQANPACNFWRFRRPNQPETPQHAGVSPSRRSRQRTAPAENTRSRGGATAGKATAAASANAGAISMDQMATSVKTRYLRCFH